MATLRGTSAELLKIVELFARCHFRYNDVHGNDVSSIDVRAAYAKAVRKIVPSTTPRVLLIMQGKLRCRAYAVMLSTFGIQCTCSSDAMDAYRQYLAPKTRVSDPEFHLIIAEWGAGETTATDLMKFLKEDGNEHFCIVALCGKDVLAGTAIRSGVDLFFRKPLALHLGVLRQLLLPRSMAIQGFPVALLRRPANHSQLKAVFEVHVDDEPTNGTSSPTAAPARPQAQPVVAHTQSNLASVDKLVREIQDEVEADELDVDRHSEEFVDEMLSYLKAHQPKHANERWHTHLQNSMQALDHARKAIQRLNDEVSACRKQAEHCWKDHGHQPATAEQALDFVGLSRFHLISRILILSQRNEALLSQISAREADLRNFQDDTASLSQSVNALLRQYMSAESCSLGPSASEGKPPRRAASSSSREIKKSVKNTRNIGAAGMPKHQRRSSAEKLVSTPLAASSVSSATAEFSATSHARGWSASVLQKVSAGLETTLMEFEDGLAERWKNRDIPASVPFHLAWPPKPSFPCNAHVYQSVRTTLEQLMALCTAHSRQILAAAPVALRSVEELEEGVYRLLGTNPVSLFHEAASTPAALPLPSTTQQPKAQSVSGQGAPVKERKSVAPSSSAANLTKQRGAGTEPPLNAPQSSTTSNALDVSAPTHQEAGNATTARIMSKTITELQAYVFQFVMRDVHGLQQRSELSLLRQRYCQWFGFACGARRHKHSPDVTTEDAHIVASSKTPPPPPEASPPPSSNMSSPKLAAGSDTKESSVPQSPSSYSASFQQSSSSPLLPRKTEDASPANAHDTENGQQQPSGVQPSMTVPENPNSGATRGQPLAPEAPKQTRIKPTPRGSVAPSARAKEPSAVPSSSSANVDMPQVAKLRV